MAERFIIFPLKKTEIANLKSNIRYRCFNIYKGFYPDGSICRRM